MSSRNRPGPGERSYRRGRRPRRLGGPVGAASAVLVLACQGPDRSRVLDPEPEEEAVGEYRVRDLIPGFPQHSTAYDINDRGEIAGVVGGRAVRWVLDASMVASDPVELNLRGGGDPGPGEAMGLNESGHVVGTLTGDTKRPFVWTETGGLRELPLPAGAEAGVAYDVNDAGQIVGTVSTDPAFEDAADGRVVVWTVDEDGDLLDILDVGTVGGTGARGHAINGRGSIVGRVWDSGSVARSFVWHPVADVEELPLESESLGMNDEGAVVGSFDGKAAVWRGGVVEEVGPPGSVARAINDVQIIVGELAVGVGGRTRAGIVISAGTIRVLEAISMIEYARPRAINDAGIIVGDVFTAGPDVAEAVYWMPR